MVDHIKRIEDGGAPLDMNNLQSMRNHPCHDKKRAKEKNDKYKQRWTMNRPSSSIPTPHNPPEAPISRAQRRAKERIEIEAKELHNTLCESFLSFITHADDPASEDVKAKAKQAGAKWKLYCSRRALKPEVRPLVDEFCNALMDEYKTLVDETK